MENVSIVAKRRVLKKLISVNRRLIEIDKNIKVYGEMDEDDDFYSQRKPSKECEFLMERQRVYTNVKKALETYVFNGFKSNILKKP